MYKVLYIGFLTFQLISVFCNLKSSKKDILEAHNSRKFNIIGIVCQIIAKTTAGDEFQNISLLLKFFWTKNIWSRQFLLIFIAFNVLASSIGSVLGYKWDDILLVNVENVSNVTKLILIIFYIVIFKNTELPNSFFIRFASKNEALLNRKN